MSRRPRRVLVVDDDPRFLSAFSDLLADHEDVQVVAAVGTAAHALDVARQQPLDVVVLDVQMAGTGGPGLARDLLAGDPGLRVLALSAAGDPRSREAMLVAGAHAYYLKVPPCTEVVEAVRSVPLRELRSPTPPVAS